MGGVGGNWDSPAWRDMVQAPPMFALMHGGGVGFDNTQYHPNIDEFSRGMVADLIPGYKRTQVSTNSPTMNSDSSAAWVNSTRTPVDPFLGMWEAYMIEELGQSQMKSLLTGTHLGDISISNRFVEAETNALVKASQFFEQHKTSENPDGTFNARIGTDVSTPSVNYASQKGQIYYLESVDTPWSTPYQSDIYLDVAGIPTIGNDLGKASEMVAGGFSLAAGLRDWYTRLGYYLNGDIPGVMDARRDGETERTTAKDLVSRKREYDRYKRDERLKAGMQRGSGRGAGGLDTADLEEALSLNKNNLLGF